MKIVVLDGYTLNPGDLDWHDLEELGHLKIYDRTPSDKIYERIKDAEVVLTNKTPLPADIITRVPNLKYIGVLATGYNIVDIDAARSGNVIVTNVPGYGNNSVAQLTFALLLELCHHVQKHSDAVMEGRWTNSADWCFWDFPLIELSGKTMGIIGFGNIGQRVADIAAAFGLKIVVQSRTQTNQFNRNNFEWMSLDELLQASDIVSIHCPLTPETKGIINSRSLKKMKRSAFLLNTSRGPIIMDQDLADALNEGIIAGAAIDVLSVEPPANDNPLFNAKNCLITPHIAWATREARTRLMENVVNNLSSFLSGNPINIVNR